MDFAGVAGVILGLKGASATCNLQPGNQLDCLLQIPEPRKSTGLIQIRKIPQPGKKMIALCLIHYQVLHKTGMILFPLLERIAVLLEVNIMEILSLIRVPVFPSSSPLVDQTNWGREDSTTSEMRILPGRNIKILICVIYKLRRIGTMKNHENRCKQSIDYVLIFRYRQFSSLTGGSN